MRRRLSRPTSANNIVDPAASNRATDVIDRQQTDDDDDIRGTHAKRPREDCNAVPFHGQSQSVANTVLYVRDVRGGLRPASALAISRLKQHGRT